MAHEFGTCSKYPLEHHHPFAAGSVLYGGVGDVCDYGAFLLWGAISVPKCMYLLSPRMHDTAKINAQAFYNMYCASLPAEAIVVDFGSYDVNGTLKPIFSRLKYKGIDMSAGPNVDIVCSNRKTPFENESVDVIISSSCFEHDDCFWMTFLEMCRILKKGGYIYINAPSTGPYHGFPGDCWRFYKDSWSALQKWAAEHSYTLQLSKSYIDPTGNWKDSVGIFKKTA